ncbi:MAG: nuclear transport factor 2 family protein [Acidobacteriota bacterium]|nr:nuclear transport factor 2 family protein [Acidobacteriota bacterium]
MNEAEDEIRKLESDLIAAVLRRDSGFLNDILADDLSVVTPFGDLVEKAMMTKFDDNLVNESIVTDEIEVRFYGEDTGIVTGRATIKSRYAEQDLSGRYRFTRVYFKREGNWKIVAYQATRIAHQEE